jgi:hypothetical protein
MSCKLRLSGKLFAVAVLAVAGNLLFTCSVRAQGGGVGGQMGGFGGGQGGFGGNFSGGGFTGSSSFIGGTTGNKISYMGVRNGFRPSILTATANTRTSGSQFGQLGGQFGQTGGQFSGGLAGNLTGRTGTGIIPRVTGSMVQETMKALPPSTSEVQARILKLLAAASSATANREITFELDDQDVLVMRGDVPTLQERRLAEALLLLEPGVGKVKNDLTVAGRPIPKPLTPMPPASGP